jgi:hypothetical protein
VYTESYQKEFNAPAKFTRKLHQQDSRSLFGSHKQRTRVLLHRHLAASTRVRLHRLPVAQALRQPCRAPRLLVTRPHGLYVNLAVRRDYSSPGRTGSTSTLPCAASTRLSAAAALHRLCRTPPRRRLMGVRLPRLLTPTSLNQKTSRGLVSIIILSLACSPNTGTNAKYYFVYASQQLPASRATPCQLFLGDR